MRYQVPVADYRLTQTLGTFTGEGREKEEHGGFDVGRRGGTGEGDRACYSFCMCPGGQVVPTSVDPREVSRWLCLQYTYIFKT